MGCSDGVLWWCSDGALMQGYASSYNMPWSLLVKGDFRPGVMKEALLATVRHDLTLRTVARFNDKTEAEQLVGCSDGVLWWGALMGCSDDAVIGCSVGVIW
jgi:hypothetical protein